jgi:hypothetical protein
MIFRRMKAHNRLLVLTSLIAVLLGCLFLLSQTAGDGRSSEARADDQGGLECNPDDLISTTTILNGNAREGEEIPSNVHAGLGRYFAYEAGLAGWDAAAFREVAPPSSENSHNLRQLVLETDSGRRIASAYVQQLDGGYAVDTFSACYSFMSIDDGEASPVKRKY